MGDNKEICIENTHKIPEQITYRFSVLTSDYLVTEHNLFLMYGTEYALYTLIPEDKQIQFPKHCVHFRILDDQQNPKIQ